MERKTTILIYSVYHLICCISIFSVPDNSVSHFIVRKKKYLLQECRCLDVYSLSVYIDTMWEIQHYKIISQINM